MNFTASALLATARLHGWLPPSPDSATDAEVLTQMTQELRLGMASLLKSVHQDYGVESATVAVSGGTAWLPKACSSLAVQSVAWVNGSQRQRLTALPAVSESDYPPTMAYPAGYYLEGSNLRVPGGWTGSVTVRYQALAPDLVATSAAAQVSSVTNATTFVTSSTPAGWATSGLSLDFISARPGAPVLQREVAAARASNTFTVASTSGLAAGDWVALAGESPLVPLPPELLTLLALRTAAQIAAASSAANAPALATILAKNEAEALKLIAPRQPQAVPIVSRYGPRGRRWR